MQMWVQKLKGDWVDGRMLMKASNDISRHPLIPSQAKIIFKGKTFSIGLCFFKGGLKDFV